MGTVINQLGRWGTNLISSSTSEATADLDLSNTSGESANFSVSVIGGEEDLLDLAQLEYPPFTNTLTSSGTLTDGKLLAISGESYGRIYNQEISLKPYWGTVNGYLYEIARACGLSSGDSRYYRFGAPTPTENRWWPGYVGDAWFLVKQVFALYGRDVPTFGTFGPPIRGNEYLGNYVSTSSPVDVTAGSQDITVHYYELLSTPELYPGSWDYADQEILTVDAGEVLETELQLNAWVRSVNQPVAVDWVPAEPSATSVYSVTGADNLPIKASQWTSHGGSITVETTDDPSVLKVRVVGPATPQLEGVDGTVKYAPYQIAMTSTEGGLWNSLHISGDGYPFIRKSVTARTGAVRGVENTEIDSVLVATEEQAWEVARKAINNNDGLKRTFSGETFENIDVGDRIRGRFGWYRVLSVESSLEGYQFEAVQDTTFQDGADHYAGMTYAQVQTLWANKKYQQFKIGALKDVS